MNRLVFRTSAAALAALSIVAVTGSSSSAPPIDRPPIGERKDEPPPSACTGYPCKVSPYEGALPQHFNLAKMKKLGCDAPFNHLGGLKEGETSWVGFSCPAHVHKEFSTLPADFSDACLPKRPGRVYVAVYEGKCSLNAFPFDTPYADTAKKLGCGPLFKYSSGNGNGFLGGIGSYCPDTKAVREATPLRLGFTAGYCDGCVKVPAGQIFRFWTADVGPNCPGGCPMGAGPGQI